MLKSNDLQVIREEIEQPERKKVPIIQGKSFVNHSFSSFEN